jgi:hypothetical protein
VARNARSRIESATGDALFINMRCRLNRKAESLPGTHSHDRIELAEQAEVVRDDPGRRRQDRR